MLFMSERQKAVTVRNEKPIFNVKTGEQIGKVRRVHANLERGYMPPWAVELAEETFTMGGKPPTVPTHRWIASYDSALAQQQEGWTDEERELIEAKLLAQGDVILIEPPKIDPPYAQYDKHRKVVGKRGFEQVTADIRAVYELAGFDIEQAVRYERQNLDDPVIIEFLQSLAPAAVELETVIEA
jgi:hypothetical protein